VRPTKKLRVLLLGSTIAVAALLVPAGVASAAPQRCEAPPGTAGIDQYCETLPGATGDRESGAGPRAGRSLDPRTSRALEQAGQDGKGVLALPASGRGEGAGSGEGSAPAKQAVRKEPSGSPIGAIGSAIESGSTAGKGFIWLLLATGVGMAGIAWLRYRRGSTT